MSNGEPIVLDDKAREAVHAARNAAQAVEEARQTQLEAAAEFASQKAAALAADKISQKIVDEERMAHIIKEQVENVLARGTEQDKTAILVRVPYICQDIKEMKASIGAIEKNIEDKFVTRYEFSPVRMLAYGVAGLLLTATVGAMVAAVFVK